MPGFELKSGARKLIRENSPKIFFVSILFIFIVTLMSELQFRLPGTMDAYVQYLDRLSAGEIQGFGNIYSYFRPSGIPFALILWLLNSVMNVGYQSFCLKISRGGKAEYKDIFDGFLFVGKVLVIKIVTNIFIILWSLLLFFPGIIAYYRYRQAYLILLDDPTKGIMQCIRESARLMHKKKLDLFLLDISFIGWVLLDYVIIIISPLPFTLPLVSIWLTPYQGLANAAFYNHLIATLAV